MYITAPTLVERTRNLLYAPPDVVVITTAIGLRGWLEAAQAAGLDGPLGTLLAGCRVIARGPKALGALQAIGVTPDWVADSE